MSNIADQTLTQSDFWEASWAKHLAQYLANPPRAGMWLRWRLGRAPLDTLEIAGGSCRDSRYLYTNGWAAVGSDFDIKTIAYLKQQFADVGQTLDVADAFQLPYADKQFDLSFHNGFYVLFNDEKTIFELLHEQLRVTKKRLVFFVHNIENKALRHNFHERAQFDPLYNIRFFSRDEIKHLIEESGIPFKSCHIEKFGGPTDAFYAKRIKRIPNPLFPLAKALVPYSYRFLPWRYVERLACIIEIAESES